MNAQTLRNCARRDVAADITAKILTELEKGVLPWRKPWDGARTGLALPRRATGETYRGVNVLNRERIEGLNAYEAAHGDAVTVEGAIGAFLRPVMEKLAEGGEGWRNYLALVAWVGNTHEWGGEVMTRSFDPVIRRLIDVIRRALPDAAEQDVYWAYHFLSGSLILTASETDRIDRLSNGVCRSTDIAAIEPRMIAYAAAGFRQICRTRSRS